jgi:hypothetical protein
MPRPKKHSDELRERAVRLVFESGRPIAHVARDLGIHREALAPVGAPGRSLMPVTLKPCDSLRDTRWVCGEIGGHEILVRTMG